MANPLEWENKNALLVQTGTNEVRTKPGGVPKIITDATPDNTNKTFTVPVGKIWDVKTICITLAATETVGNRSIFVHYKTSGGIEFFRNYSDTIAASQTRVKSFSSGGNGSNLPLANNIPSGLLPAGTKINIWDANAIAPTADDMTIGMLVIEYDA